MLEKYIVAKFEIIEQNGQRLFYCLEEDFTFNALSANLWGWASFRMRISFDGMVYTSGTLSEIGTHGAMMMFAWFHDAFGKKRRPVTKLFAHEFAVGDQIVFDTVFVDDVPRQSVEQLIKIDYLRNGVEGRFFCKNRFITHDEFLQLTRDDKSELFYCVCDCALPVEVTQSMVKAIWNTGVSGWKFFDDAKTIIFWRFGYEKII